MIPEDLHLFAGYTWLYLAAGPTFLRPQMPNLPPPADLPPTAGGAYLDSQATSVHRIAATLPPPVAGSDSTVRDENVLVPVEKRASRFGDRVPAWIVSLILHTVLIIALVLAQTHAKLGSNSFLLARIDDLSDLSVERIHLPPEPVDSDRSGDADELLVMGQSQYASSMQVSIDVLSPLAEPKEEGASSSPVSGALSTANQLEMRSLHLPTGGLHARDSKDRAALGAKYGATEESEDAVEAALKWLALHQRPNGSWSFDLSLEPCNGRCSHSQKSLDDSPRPATAATGLALLAFLGAGYSHHEGIYADNVRRGLYYLREVAREAQYGLDLQSGSMYGHGIAFLAISEAMAMTRYQGKQDSDLFSLTDGAATFTMVAQHERGGWRYIPGSPGDMTVTAWQVLALISAQHGGVVLRTDTLSRAERFVRGLSKPGSYEFGYQTTTPKTSTTAIGLCLLLYLGQSPENTLFQRSLDRIVERGPSRSDLYLDYYATLALHHARHPDWDAWHRPLRDHLVKSQSKEGHEAGSWHFEDLHGDVGGRLYSTAMAAMILEVYYRYLPLYKPREEFTLD